MWLLQENFLLTSNSNFCNYYFISYESISSFVTEERLEMTKWIEWNRRNRRNKWNGRNEVDATFVLLFTYVTYALFTYANKIFNCLSKWKDLISVIYEVPVRSPTIKYYWNSKLSCISTLTLYFIISNIFSLFYL